MFIFSTILFVLAIDVGLQIMVAICVTSRWCRLASKFVYFPSLVGGINRQGEVTIIFLFEKGHLSNIDLFKLARHSKERNWKHAGSTIFHTVNVSHKESISACDVYTCKLSVPGIVSIQLYNLN